MKRELLLISSTLFKEVENMKQNTLNFCDWKTGKKYSLYKIFRFTWWTNKHIYIIVMNELKSHFKCIWIYRLQKQILHYQKQWSSSFLIDNQFWICGNLSTDYNTYMLNYISFSLFLKKGESCWTWGIFSSWVIPNDNFCLKAVIFRISLNTIHHALFL